MSSTARNALTKSQSLVDSIRRLERLYTQKEDLQLILKNIPDAIDSAYCTVEQSLYKDNPNDKRISISINLVHQNPADINIIAEDLLEEIVPIGCLNIRKVYGISITQDKCYNLCGL